MRAPLQISDEEYAYLDARLRDARVDPKITCKMDLDTMREIVAIEHNNNNNATCELASEEQQQEGLVQQKKSSIGSLVFRGQSFSAPGR